MSRLYDDVVTRADPARVYPSLLRWLHQVLQSAQQFDISNVARYYYVDTAHDTWRLSRDFPNLAPPYPVSWYEYAESETINSEKQGMIQNPGNIDRFGSLVMATDLDKNETPPIPIRGIPGGARWVLISALYFRSSQRVSMCPTLSVLFVDRGGAPLVEHSPDGDMVDYLQMDMSASLETKRVQMDLVGLHLNPVWMAISLLHCKNIVIEDHQPPLVRPKRDRRRNVSRYAFKTLRVVPMRRIVKKDPGSSTGDRSGSRFHHMRGHFKTYTDDAPLFGLWVGTWWWSDQTFGDMSLGIINKSYKIDHPRQDPA